MFLLSDKLLQDRHQVVAFSFIISVLSSSCSCDCSAAERADPSDCHSCSLLETSSFLTKRGYFCFGCLFLVRGASGIVESWVSGLAKVSLICYHTQKSPLLPEGAD